MKRASAFGRICIVAVLLGTGAVASMAVVRWLLGGVIVRAPDRQLGAQDVEAMLAYLTGQRRPALRMNVVAAEATQGFGADIKWVLLECGRAEVMSFKEMVLAQGKASGGRWRLHDTDAIGSMPAQKAGPPGWWVKSDVAKADALLVEVLGGGDGKRVSVAYRLAFSPDSGRVYLMYWGK